MPLTVPPVPVPVVACSAEISELIIGNYESSQGGAFKSPSLIGRMSFKDFTG